MSEVEYKSMMEYIARKFSERTGDDIEDVREALCMALSEYVR